MDTATLEQRTERIRAELLTTSDPAKAAKLRGYLAVITKETAKSWKFKWTDVITALAYSGLFICALAGMATYADSLHSHIVANNRENAVVHAVADASYIGTGIMSVLLAMLAVQVFGKPTLRMAILVAVGWLVWLPIVGIVMVLASL